MKMMTALGVAVLAALVSPSAVAVAGTPKVDFASLSVQYSLYPSLDAAQRQIGKVVPAGLPAQTARERLTALGMRCAAVQTGLLRCRYATSVTIDAMYIDPVTWTVLVRDDADAVSKVDVTVD